MKLQRDALDFASVYLPAAQEESASLGSQQALLSASQHIARFQGMAAVAQLAGIPRECVCRAMSANATTIKTRLAMLGAAGLQMAVIPEPGRATRLAGRPRIRLPLKLTSCRHVDAHLGARTAFMTAMIAHPCRLSGVMRTTQFDEDGARHDSSERRVRRQRSVMLVAVRARGGAPQGGDALELTSVAVVVPGGLSQTVGTSGPLTPLISARAVLT